MLVRALLSSHQLDWDPLPARADDAVVASATAASTTSVRVRFNMISPYRLV
ncbi:MAG TPA: hypothetical protein VFT31_09020 [Kribbella sp.]|nr:hypothetical protein [Kribbella sp.]